MHWRQVATSWSNIGPRAGIVSRQVQASVRVSDRVLKARGIEYMGDWDRTCVASVTIPPDGGPYEWTSFHRIAVGPHDNTRGHAPTVAAAKRAALRGCGRALRWQVADSADLYRRFGGRA